ncbi:hypothetical protein LCGC14_0577610 [marine sediment metagenome]|uniref:Uncharacterized protein n=1 Tax=marine sediment metagenome TaxID=412755 RepID=A0A0F9UQP6_9ZZZZ
MVNENNTLNLDDLTASAPRIKLGADSYPLLLPKHLGLQKAAVAQRLGSKFISYGNRMAEVQDNKEMSEEEKEVEIDKVVEEMGTSLNEFLDIVMPSMPKEERVKLDDTQQMAIMDFFSEQAAQSVAFQREILVATSQRSPSTAGSATKSS